jgi:imidazolonepropionase-like amidohydrolase
MRNNVQSMYSRERALCIVLLAATCLRADQPAASGTFVLHKFAKAIGKETYSITEQGERYTLTSQFEFTDRGSKVPLETKFAARTNGLVPISYRAKGKSSRFSDMDDAVTVEGKRLSIVSSSKKETAAATGSWFITDGYSPVAMQEQMMRWWLAHGRPQEFTVYPTDARVRIAAAGPLDVSGKSMQGYTVAGLIWGEESLWMDDAQNLAALVSTDAEFDHFEAVREPYESSLSVFIAAAVKADLAALAQLTANASAARSERLAITGATLENSTGAAPVSDSVILIEHGVITAAGPRREVSIPKDATVLDATGKFAIPGLWDMHAHYEQVEWGPIYLAAGVTSVRDVGNEFDFIRTVHDQLDRAEHAAIGPHLEFAGIIDGTGPISLGAVIADTPEQAFAWVGKYKAAGARQIKIYSSVKAGVVKAITTAAHARGMTVTGHIPEGMTAIDGVNDGMDQINHLDYLTPYFERQKQGADGKPDRSKTPEPDLDGARAKQLIAVLREHHTVLDPTMSLFEVFAHTGPLDRLEPGVEHLPAQLKRAVDSPPAPPGKQADLAMRRKISMGALRRLHAAGIPIIAGTDQAVPGYSLHREIEIYVEAGFTPLEALQAATIQAARAVGVEKESGSLEPGKRGDVLLLDADPLADIHNTRRVWRTVAAGVVYEPAPLWRTVGFTP